MSARTLGAALGLGVVLTIAAVFWQRSTPAKSTAPTLDTAVADERLSEKSLYQLQSTWTRSDGSQVQLSSLRGHFQVLVLMFTQCEGSCPVLVKKVQYFADTLPSEARQRTRFLLVSVDPDNDTPAVLEAYRRTMALDADRWTLLRGAKDDVRELAAVLGFSYEQIDSGAFVHSDVVTLLSPSGEIVKQVTGAATDLAPLTKVISQHAH
jgi:protein SCO1